MRKVEWGRIIVYHDTASASWLFQRSDPHTAWMLKQSGCHRPRSDWPTMDLMLGTVLGVEGSTRLQFACR